MKKVFGIFLVVIGIYIGILGGVLFPGLILISVILLVGGIILVAK
jgi:hypothetical protein